MSDFSGYSLTLRKPDGSMVRERIPVDCEDDCTPIEGIGEAIATLVRFGACRSFHALAYAIAVVSEYETPDSRDIGITSESALVQSAHAVIGDWQSHDRKLGTGKPANSFWRTKTSGPRYPKSLQGLG